MPEHDIVHQEVPPNGPLELGAVYRRQHLNDRFGGNRMTGIVASPREPVVLLFHTEEPVQQFYQDGFDDDGIYWYSGEGTRGDMQWTAANRAIRDHVADGRDLLLFERVQRKHGLWRFAHVVSYFDHKVENRPDIEGKPRDAIIFGLLPISETAVAAAIETAPAVPKELGELRQLIGSKPAATTTVKQRVEEVYLRSAVVAEYARVRAAGVCEACNSPAPFVTAAGKPFLEVHHIDRLADGGPDLPDRVAAICPNCHRRCHYSADAQAFNGALRASIAAKEAGFSL
jgi:5-methylcytosine-specific restriction protein A